MTVPTHGYGPARLLLVFALVLLGLIGVGRLAMEAWLIRSAPETLPEFGARTDKASPYLLVIIDGLREPSAWATEDAPMPWLQTFAKRGAYGTAIAGEPTLTAPCVRALLTGRRPDLLTGFRNFNARPVQGSVIGYLRARGAETAHGGDAAAFQFCIQHYPLERVLQFPDQGPTDQGQCDAQAVPHVIAQIEDGADCITLHLTGPDHAGHKHGATGRHYWDACRKVDGQIRSVVEVFLERYPQGTVLVAADHGVSAMGTHGGGEATAKRAPFVLVGPDVAQVHLPSIHPQHRVDQCSLAPTVCMLLGLPQPPLADAPPAPEMSNLPPAVETEALEAYVRARLAVARSLHGDAVDVIEQKRAQQDVEHLVREVNMLLLPNNAGHATGALLLAGLWLVLLVGFVSLPRVPRGPAILLSALALLVIALLMLDPMPAWFSLSAPVAGLFVLAGCALAYVVTRARPLGGWTTTVACLAALPVLTGAGITLQETFTSGASGGEATTRLLWVGLLALLLVGALMRPRAVLPRLRTMASSAPGLIPAFGGVLIGFTLTLRPFIDPHIHVMILYAVGGCAVVGLMLWSSGARARPVWERALLALVGLVLFVATRVAEGMAGEVWVNITPMRDAGWLLAGVLLSLLMLVLAFPRGALRANAVGLGLAALALGAACLVRYDRQAFWDTAVALSDALPFLDPAYMAGVIRNGFALIALAWAVVRGTPDGRLFVRLAAGVALARQLSVMDAEFAVFALAAVGAALAARLKVPVTRVGIAWLAVGVLALRTAIFHAMGFEESFSTLDVGQAFAGLEATEQRLDAAGGAVITGQIVVAGIQLALRMALPWILLLAALVRATERTADTLDLVRCAVGDLTVSYAARGASIAVALWAWWRNSWWMTHAYTVYAYAAADVVLLLVCGALCGVFRGSAWRREAGVPERGGPVAA
ncbi:MAG: alkaline phosphatase family protein [Planctomycetota bacterium]|nr:alkaline phosphatase family protein [Planctomycetota bacterium]